MMKKKDQEYFKYGIIENAKFWKRLGGKPYFANRKILDFGCGHGSLCIDIANSGAESITGIDIGEAIDFAKENLIFHSGFTLYVHFTIPPELDKSVSSSIFEES